MLHSHLSQELILRVLCHMHHRVSWLHQSEAITQAYWLQTWKSGQASIPEGRRIQPTDRYTTFSRNLASIHLTYRMPSLPLIVHPFSSWELSLVLKSWSADRPHLSRSSWFFLPSQPSSATLPSVSSWVFTLVSANYLLLISTTFQCGPNQKSFYHHCLP